MWCGKKYSCRAETRCEAREREGDTRHRVAFTGVRVAWVTAMSAPNACHRCAVAHCSAVASRCTHPPHSRTSRHGKRVHTLSLPLCSRDVHQRTFRARIRLGAYTIYIQANIKHTMRQSSCTCGAPLTVRHGCCSLPSPSFEACTPLSELAKK